MKHMTGRLEVVKANDGSGRLGIRNDLGEIVGDVAGFTNAREIANLWVAAPALAEACEAFIEWASEKNTTYCDFREVILLARAALAQVRGEVDDGR